MAAAQVSSPRLPSPPPLTEDFIHPKSPITISEDQGKLENASKVDHGASRRIRPGTKAANMAEGPPLVELSEIESSFALTEHLKALHNAAVHADADTTKPIDRETALRLAQPPEDVDRAAWLHELCRFLCQRVNTILVALFADAPPCSATTCPEMRASEWQYLCAVHDPPKSCCAIDYCCHTLDWAATTLTSAKNFPHYGGDRTVIADTSNQQGRVRQLTNVFRRVYRIFAHAWFQHREMFWKVEHTTGLYIFFKTVCDVYQLIPEDNYTIPPEAEGGEPEKSEESSEQPVLLLQREVEETQEGTPDPAGAGLTAANTTKRHRHSPSAGATAVDTVIEETEEEDEAKGTLSRADTSNWDPAGKVSYTAPEDADSQPDASDEATLVKVSVEAEKPDISISKPDESEAASGEEFHDTPIALKLEEDSTGLPALASAPKTEESETDNVKEGQTISAQESEVKSEEDTKD